MSAAPAKTRRVVVVGPVLDPDLERWSTKRPHTLVAGDLRHALLLQRVFLPDVIVLPRVPDQQEVGLVATSATRPVIVVAHLRPAEAVVFLRQGVARVVSPSTLGSIENILGAPLPSERPVVRALAQLALQKASGVLRVGVEGSPGGDVVVDNGSVYLARAGGKSGGEALALLVALEAPVFFAFEEARDPKVVVGEALEVIDLDVEGADLVVASTTTAELSALRQPRCLIVEDDPDLSRLYQILLKGKGFDVEVADDGEAGMAAAKAHPPDVILSDIMMPRVTGWDLLGLVRSNARLRETPFLLLSHHGELVRKLESANGGADGYLEKSSRPEVVVAAVALAVRPLRQLEVQLQSGSARVDGTLAGIGPQTMLRLMERLQLTGRLAMRPASQRFLVGFKDGDVVEAQCSMGTATLRQRDALRALLLVDDGPFTFVRAPVTAPVTTGPKTPLPQVLDELCGELERMLDQLRKGIVLSGQALRVRPELLAIYRASAPPASFAILDALSTGGTPRDVVTAGVVDPVLIDSVVRDLFRKGVIAP